MSLLTYALLAALLASEAALILMMGLGMRMSGYLLLYVSGALFGISLVGFISVDSVAIEIPAAYQIRFS